MLFPYFTFVSLLALCKLSIAAAIIQERATTSNMTLYVYGGDANGAPVFYSNGLAYVGNQAPAWSGTSTNITFTVQPDDSTVPWTITPNSTTVTFSATMEMYIIPTTGSFEQVGFVASNSTAPTDAVTTGFTFFGTEVAYAATESNYEMMFWATSTNETDIYALHWNANGSPSDGSFPVVVKSTPPNKV